MANTMNDSDLVLGFKNPDSRNYCFNILVRKYQQKIYWLIRRMVGDHDDANDIAQNTWIKVWNNLEGFKEEAQLYTWLYRIASNETLTFLEKQKRKPTFKMEDVERELESVSGDGTDIDGEEIQKKLELAIASLPEKQKIVFQFRYFDEMPYEEMSKVLETSVGALKASYFHAAKKVEQFIISSI